MNNWTLYIFQWYYALWLPFLSFLPYFCCLLFPYDCLFLLPFILKEVAQMSSLLRSLAYLLLSASSLKTEWSLHRVFLALVYVLGVNRVSLRAMTYLSGDVRKKSESVSHSVVSDSAMLRTVARQAPLSMGLSRQEYWSGLPFPSPGNLPNPGIEPGSPALQADSLLF